MEPKKKKPGRPPLVSRHQLTIHLTDKQYRAVRSIMRKEDMRSMSAVIRQMVEERAQ